jgi:spectrin beta
MVGRLCCTDGSEFLFLAATEREMEDWVNKISFHAKLPPSLQLLSYDDSHKVRRVVPYVRYLGTRDEASAAL